MSVDNIINTQIHYRLIEEIQNLQDKITNQGKSLEAAELEKENEKLSEKLKQKSLELRIRNSDLKAEKKSKYEIEKDLISLNKCFSNFSNNYEENIKKLLNFIKQSVRSSSALYFHPDHKVQNKKQEFLYEIYKNILDSSSEEFIVMENFKKSPIYQENTNIFSRNINCLILYRRSSKNVGYRFFALTFDKKFDQSNNIELLLSLTSHFIEIEEDRKTVHEDLISLYKEVAILNRRISVISNYSSQENRSQEDSKKQLLKLLSTSSNSLISFFYIRKYHNKFDRVVHTCSENVAKELEENIINKLQLLGITQNNKKRFYLKFTDEDMKDKTLKKHKISSATSIPILKGKKHLGNLVLLHQNNLIPTSADLEYYNLICLVISRELE